jgi:hypothetical protein
MRAALRSSGLYFASFEKKMRPTPYRQDADATVQRARDNADAVLDEARDKADKELAEPPPAATTSTASVP